MSHNFFSRGYTQLRDGSANFAAKTTASPTTYGLTEQQATAYSELNGSLQSAFAATTDPETRTRSSIATRNAVAKTCRAMLSDLSKIINGTPSVTDAMKIDLGLGIPKPRGPIPAPTERPGVDLISVEGRSVMVNIHDSASSTKRGKPAGAAAAWVYSFVGDTYPTDIAQWRVEGSTTKAKHTITFPNEVPAGQQVWIRAAWINRKQEMGPLSTPITTNLQGGGTASQAMKIAA